MSPAPDDLAALRREIDSIDEQLHDLLMRRGEVVSEIGRRKTVDGQVTFRPAREAQLLHRLLARHQGDLSHASIVRLWREIIAASIRIQGQLTVGYCPIEGHGSALRLANGHFGFDTPTVRFESASHVVSAVHRGEVSVGLVPLPEAADTPGWWADVRDATDVYVVARLPWFDDTAAGAGASVGASVLARGIPEESGDDHSLLMFTCPKPVSRARVGEVCGTNGLEITAQAVTDDPHAAGERIHIVELDGFIDADDDRTQAVAVTLEASNVRLLGAFARPFVSTDTAGVK
ncbi:MAG: chorismate mutase [Rhodospirillaceae bacterium]|jgi:chorismate mutase / prephenate dehydratase|nr:chorismate mutase [Rhodospirillaceae bacterium]MBT6537648.1 chorismate mutase [Rhodospirillaceae bacterium]